jgi:hypothetical protein
MRPTPATKARGRKAAGQRTDERAGGIRRDQDARAGLRKTVVLRVAREERDERREEHRVGEDDGADEENEPAHPATLPDR